MKAYKNRKALTIVEILIVIVVIAILTSMIVTVATRLNTQGKIKLTQASLAVINAAIEQFRDYEYNYYGQFVDYDFPLDCNNLEYPNIAEALGAPLGTPIVVIPPDRRNLWCFFLTRVPQCRQTLDEIDDEFKQQGTITINSRLHTFVIITDSWQTPLQYEYNYYIGQNFPLITSAGPDGQFDTTDDINNEQ